MSEPVYDITHKEYMEARNRIETFKALNRLRQNKDFQLLIEKGYLTEYPIQLTHSLASTNNGSVEESKLFSSLKAVSSFKEYLDVLESTIRNDEETVTFYESN